MSRTGPDSSGLTGCLEMPKSSAAIGHGMRTVHERPAWSALNESSMRMECTS